MTLWQRLIDRVAPLAGEDVSNLDRLDGIARTAPQPTTSTGAAAAASSDAAVTDGSGHGDGQPRYLLRPATRLIVVAMTTAPNR